MRAKIKEKEEAIRMRLAGHTLPEIARKLHVSKGSAYLWLKDVELPLRVIKYLEKRKKLAQDNGRAMMKRIRAERDRQIREKAQSDFSKVRIDRNTSKLLCAALYWAEGHKGKYAVGFTNSDPAMIRTFLALLRTSFDIEESKLYAWLHLHGYHSIEKQKKFWHKITGIPTQKINIYLKPNTGTNIRVGYPGCICIKYGDVKLAKEIEFLYTCLVNEFRGVV